MLRPPPVVLYEVMAYVPALGVTPRHLAQPRFHNPRTDCHFCRRRREPCFYRYIPPPSDVRLLNRVAYDSVRLLNCASYCGVYDATRRYFEKARVGWYIYPLVCTRCVQERCVSTFEVQRVARAARKPCLYFFPEELDCVGGGAFLLRRSLVV